MPDKNYP